jgi:molybdopterin synthase catalytic subunit
MKTIRVQQEDFDYGVECESLAASGTDVGAVVFFLGLVRGDRGLDALVLEHYPGMTEREISRHVVEAEKRWPLAGVTVVHRVGRLHPGERIVLVAVASSHRAAAFEAAQFLMDYLKTSAPFWKQEHRGQDVEWVVPKDSDAAAAIKWRHY